MKIVIWKTGIVRRSIKLGLTIVAFLAFGAKVEARPPWLLDSSSYSTNVTTYGTGSVGDSDVDWIQAATASASYSAGNSALSVTIDGTAHCSAGLSTENDYANLGDDLTAMFEANADATWTPNGGGGGPSVTITSSGSLSGFVSVTNLIQFNTNTCQELWTISDAAGKGAVAVTASGSDDPFLSTYGNAELTNFSDALPISTNATSMSSNATFSDQYIDIWGYSGDGWVYCNSVEYADFAISWSTDYTTEDGLTGFSGDGTVEGIALADYGADDPDNGVWFQVEGWVSMSGTASIALTAEGAGGGGGPPP
jgi:hypothetical protein